MGWWERRKLKRELRRVEWQIWDFEVMFSDARRTGSRGVYPWGRKQRDKIKRLIEQHDSRQIVRQAERFGIEIPVKPEWFTTEIKHIDPDNLESEEVMDRWLNETGRTMIERQVKEARFAYWKRWADILVPILALIVAIIALLKD